MPFLGLDWRSPGEQWVKTDEGWERLKLLRNFNTIEGRLSINFNDASSSDSDSDSGSSEQFRDCCKWQPHCYILIKSTKERSGYTSLGEAFRRLDFKGAVRDIRRFNYVCKLLHILITEKLPSLSGCARRLLFNVLEEVAIHVTTTQQNLHILHQLMTELNKAMVEYSLWGHHIGSVQLWNKHKEIMESWTLRLADVEIKEPPDDGSMKLMDLPEECIRLIMLCFDDHRDLVRTGQAHQSMEKLLKEQRIWKELCQFHFTGHQMNTVIQYKADRQWEQAYYKLKRYYGMKEYYAEMIHLCSHCKCLFWKSLGHPCLKSLVHPCMRQMSSYRFNDKTASIPIPPRMFLQFFSI